VVGHALKDGEGVAFANVLLAEGAHHWTLLLTTRLEQLPSQREAV
jgi:hypothetical protein